MSNPLSLSPVRATNSPTNKTRHRQTEFGKVMTVDTLPCKRILLDTRWGNKKGKGPTLRLIERRKKKMDAEAHYYIFFFFTVVLNEEAK